MAGTARDGRTQESRRLWDEMRSRGIEPERASTGALVVGLCRAGQLKQALSVTDSVWGRRENEHEEAADEESGTVGHSPRVLLKLNNK